VAGRGVSAEPRQGSLGTRPPEQVKGEELVEGADAGVV
jgi:hypothetical protein